MATTHDAPASTSLPGEAETDDVRGEIHHLFLQLTGPMYDRLEDLVRRSGYDQAELINLAIALFKVSLDAVEGGKRVGIVADDRGMEMEFSGFHKDDPTAE